VVIADFTTMAFCDCAVLQRMLAVRSYAPPAALSSAWWSAPAGPVRRILKSTGLEQQFQLNTHCVPRGADAPDTPPRAPRGLNPAVPGH
jgi:hypothetical protein